MAGMNATSVNKKQTNNGNKQQSPPTADTRGLSLYKSDLRSEMGKTGTLAIIHAKSLGSTKMWAMENVTGMCFATWQGVERPRIQLRNHSQDGGGGVICTSMRASISKN